MKLNTLSRHTGLAVLAVAAIFAFGVAPAVAAEDCYRGTLDKRYCDRNRDQVADLPLDPRTGSTQAPSFSRTHQLKTPPSTRRYGRALSTTWRRSQARK